MTRPDSNVVTLATHLHTIVIIFIIFIISIITRPKVFSTHRNHHRLRNLQSDSPRPSHHRLIIAKMLLSGQHLPPIIVITIVVIVIIITVIRSSSPLASSLLLHGIIALVNQTTKHQQFKLNDYPFRQNHQNQEMH